MTQEEFYIRSISLLGSIANRLVSIEERLVSIEASMNALTALTDALDQTGAYLDVKVREGL